MSEAYPLPNLEGKIRRATREDVRAIVQLIAEDQLGQTREVLSDPLPESYYQAFEAINVDPNQFLAVLEINFEVVGTLQLTYLPGLSRMGSWRAQVEAVRIRQDVRNQRLGEYLMIWAIYQARQRGCSLVQLTTDKSRASAHRFYERLGFVASHEGMKLKL